MYSTQSIWIALAILGWMGTLYLGVISSGFSPSDEQLPTEGVPKFEISSASVPTLYQSCGNDLILEIADLKEQDIPSLSATNAEVIPRKGSTRFRIVPTGKNCNLIVSVGSESNGDQVTLGNAFYKVIQPPKPSIDMAINGKISSGNTPIPKTSRVQIRLVPDADFEASMPMDAKYGISEISVLAALSLGEPIKVNSINTAGKDATKPIQVSLGTQVRQAPTGTKLILRIEEIYRRNFQGKLIPDNRFTEVEKSIGLIVR